MQFYKLITFVPQLNELERGIHESIETILVELKLKFINNLMIKMNTYSELLSQKLDSHRENQTSLLYFLFDFVQDYETSNLENTVIEQLDEVALGSKTLINLLIDFFRQYHLSKSSSLRQSTNKFVNEFYLSILMLIEKSQSLLELTISLMPYFRGYIYEGAGMNDAEWMRLRRIQTNKKLFNSWRSVVNVPYVFEDFIIYANLNESVSHVSFKRFLQTHFVPEKRLKGHCDGSCKDITIKRHYWDQYCKGDLHYCYDVLDMFEAGTVVYSVSIADIL